MDELKYEGSFLCKKVVLVGGGTGVSELIAELRKTPRVQLAAIITVFDSGGSTGVLREQLKIAAVGDLRKCFFGERRKISSGIMRTAAAR